MQKKNWMAATLLMGFATQVPAADLAEQNERGLDQLLRAANGFCTMAPHGGSSRSLDVSAKVDARLDGLYKSLASAEGNLAARTQLEQHDGVLRDQVLAAIEHADNCRLEVLRLLKDKFLPPASQATQGIGSGQTTYGPSSQAVGEMNGGTIINVH